MDANTSDGSRDNENRADQPKKKTFLPPGYVIMICKFCKHFNNAKDETGSRKSSNCNAFPEYIPSEISANNFDHRMPHPDDNGIQFALFETRETTPEYFDALSDDALKEWVLGIFDHLDRSRRLGLVLPPLVEDDNDEAIIEQLERAREYSVYPLPYIHAPYFPPSLIDKLIQQARERIATKSNQMGKSNDQR